MHFYKISPKSKCLYFLFKPAWKIFLMIQLFRIHGIPSFLSLTKHILQFMLIKYLKYNNNLLNNWQHWQQIHCGNSDQKYTGMYPEYLQMESCIVPQSLVSNSWIRPSGKNRAVIRFPSVWKELSRHKRSWD